MRLGVAIPVIDQAVGGDPAAIREFAQVAEEIGYQDLSAPDHVLGVNVATRPDWGDRNTSIDLFQDPFVLFGFLAGCTKTVEFSTQVLILAQRQTVLVAKQAACLDVLCGGRFRFGVGVGWNPVEFTGLNENFHNRGRRSEEQVEVMQALWAEPRVTFASKHRTIGTPGSTRCRFIAGSDLVRWPCRATLHRSSNGATAGCRWPTRLAMRPLRRLPNCAASQRRPAAIRPASASIRGCRWALAPRPNGAKRCASGNPAASPT